MNGRTYNRGRPHAEHTCRFWRTQPWNRKLHQTADGNTHRDMVPQTMPCHAIQNFTHNRVSPVLAHVSWYATAGQQCCRACWLRLSKPTNTANMLPASCSCSAELLPDLHSILTQTAVQAAVEWYAVSEFQPLPIYCLTLPVCAAPHKSPRGVGCEHLAYTAHTDPPQAV